MMKTDRSFHHDGLTGMTMLVAYLLAILPLTGCGSRAVREKLSAEVRFVQVTDNGAIDLDLVLKNRSDAPISLFELWNSWGAHQWEFEVIDADGVRAMFVNPQSLWLANSPTTFAIAPGEGHVVHARLAHAAMFPEHSFLGFSWWESDDAKVLDGRSLFTNPEEASISGDGWKHRRFPLRVTGLFTSAEENPHPIPRPRPEPPNWFGTIRSSALVITGSAAP